VPNWGFALGLDPLFRLPACLEAMKSIPDLSSITLLQVIPMYRYDGNLFFTQIE